MIPAEYWIEHLKLFPHPEGGFYKETYRSSEVVDGSALPSRFGGDRNYSTAIYFLLRAQDRSLFHRIKSDELWHWHAGGALNIYVLGKDGLTVYTLGSDLEAGHQLQVVVPANHWFGAKVSEGGEYTLSGCTVAPGFDFVDFEMGVRGKLLEEFPGFEAIIGRLTSD